MDGICSGKLELRIPKFISLPRAPLGQVIKKILCFINYEIISASIIAIINDPLAFN